MGGGSPPQAAASACSRERERVLVGPAARCTRIGPHVKGGEGKVLGPLGKRRLAWWNGHPPSECGRSSRGPSIWPNSCTDSATLEITMYRRLEKRSRARCSLDGY